MIAAQRLRGYRREDGRFGIRNHVAVISAADNVNPLVYELARRHPIVPIPATFGRGQIGEDFAQTIRTMGHLASHPNVYRALVVSFEPESAARIAAVARDAGRPCEELSMLATGSWTASLETASRLLERWLAEAKEVQSEPMGANEVVLGLECGGSDATSGLVANPALGKVADALLSAGGTAIFSEPIELTGCEPMLDRRARTPEIARAIRRSIARYEKIARDAGVDLVGNNPTPDNIAGGLTTIEEKSMGSVAKSGSTPIEGVLQYGERPTSGGLWLMDAPAGGVENTTALAAGGANIIVFTTGSVNPTGNPLAPTLKVCANPQSMATMAEHVDVDLSQALLGSLGLDDAAQLIADAVVGIAEGKLCAAERLGFVETRVSKTGLSI